MANTGDISLKLANGKAHVPLTGGGVDLSWARPLLERPVDASLRTRVICIGAGFSGIGAAIHMRENIDDVDFQIYDQADDIGGVWHQNRYAGVACDVPSHTYQYSFFQNTQWSSFYAPGPEIHRYLKKVVEHYRLDNLIKLRHQVIGARWSPESGKWLVKVLNMETGNTFIDEGAFVIYATGLLSKPKWPTAPGLDSFKGILHHSATWDAAKEESQPDFSWGNKRVAVIGAGSSGIQIMPEMQRKAKHVTNFVRGATWLSASFASSFQEKLDPNSSSSNHKFTSEERNNFKDAEYYRRFRREIERELNSRHKMTEQGEPLQLEIRAELETMMKTKLASKPEIARKLIPDFPVACKRLTPGPGYLECLTKENVDFFSEEIMSFTERGIRTADNREHEFDAIICATGFDTTAVPGFPIHGSNNVNLQELWAEEPKQYLAVGVPRMPNFFSLMTVQSGVGSGSLLVVMEQQIAFITKCIQKCIREGYKSIMIKDSAVDSFLRYADDYFDRTVYTANCKSWYKNGATGKAKIRTLWPGSCLHAFAALRDPRWEDFEYERCDEHHHPMAWLGNGDVAGHLDRTFYIDELWAMHKEHPMYHGE